MNPASPTSNRRVICIAIGVYLALGGAWALYPLGATFTKSASENLGEVIMGIALPLVMLATGILLLRSHPAGRPLTLFTFGVQMLGLSNPYFTWQVHFPLSGGVYAQLDRSEEAGYTWSSTAGAHFNFSDWLYCAVGGPHPELSTHLVSINLFAIALFVVVWRVTRRTAPALPASAPAA